MLTISGNGHLARTPELRHTNGGDPVTTVTVASDRRDRQADAIYVDLVIFGKQATAATEHLTKGQAVAFSGRFEPRPYTNRDGKDRVAYEAHFVDLEYGSKPRGHDDPAAPDPEGVAGGRSDEDIPF